MALLKPAVLEAANLKAGFMGFQKSGKTHTAMLIAQGLAGMTKKPIAFYDTETGSDYWVARMQELGIQFFRVKTRSFTDLLSFVKECEANGYIGLIDSITHVWTGFTENYRKEKNRDRLQFQDWNFLKTEWGKFTLSYLNSNCHLLLCGRAGFEYDTEEDDKGNKELVKTGTKMKAESEMGYEPSLLVEMVRVKQSMTERKVKRGKLEAPDVSRKGWINRAIVLGDRFDVIDGAEFDFPTFESFLPHIQRLNLGGTHVGIDASRTEQDKKLFESGGTTGTDYAYKRKCEVKCEELKNLFVLAGISGQGKDERKQVAQLLQRHFLTTSWTAVEHMELDTLIYGFQQIKADLISSGQLPAEETPAQPLDEIPKALQGTERDDLPFD